MEGSKSQQSGVQELGQKWEVMEPPKAFQPQVLLHSFTQSANFIEFANSPWAVFSALAIQW